jgi:serine/threonine protein kinase
MPDSSDDKTLSKSTVEVSFTSIGPYRLVQMLAIGGMGEVWRAEQTEPFHRTVALKLIKAGMDTRAVVARFESERQALALMEHPNIAKVFDAGATPVGRPYFVMEYVPGLAITDYCDKHKLTIKERLALFMQVCEGVQHAHQKGVIHRDLKPSNVLVEELDNKAVPKIIDFGLASDEYASVVVNRGRDVVVRGNCARAGLAGRRARQSLAKRRIRSGDAAREFTARGARQADCEY